MPDLTKKESMYFIITAIIALTVLIGTLVLWSQTQTTCWTGKTEAQAIRECEG
jgi:hypothetical protein